MFEIDVLSILRELVTDSQSHAVMNSIEVTNMYKWLNLTKIFVSFFLFSIF